MAESRRALVLHTGEMCWTYEGVGAQSVAQKNYGGSLRSAVKAMIRPAKAAVVEYPGGFGILPCYPGSAGRQISR